MAKVAGFFSDRHYLFDIKIELQIKIASIVVCALSQITDNTQGIFIDLNSLFQNSTHLFTELLEEIFLASFLHLRQWPVIAFDHILEDISYQRVQLGCRVKKFIICIEDFLKDIKTKKTILVLVPENNLADFWEESFRSWYLLEPDINSIMVLFIRLFFGLVFLI